jgi:hypothetical protein
MRRIAWAVLVLVPLSFTLAGCGRPSMPGKRYSDRPKVDTGAIEGSALPKSPFWEAGPANAKVRVLAFLYIDDAHKAAQDTLRALVKAYPEKVYVKYVDPRTPEGAQIQQRAGSAGGGVLINGENGVELKTNPPRALNFGGEMGRFWTADDLNDAVAQEVKKAYGK